MRRPTSSTCLLAAALVLASVDTVAAQAACDAPLATLNAAEPDTAASITFEAAWRLVKTSYFDSTRTGARFDSLYLALRPRNNESLTSVELRSLITKLLGSLGGSHMQVIAAATSAGGTGTSPTVADVGVELRVMSGQVLFSTVRGGAAADGQNIRRGWRLLAIDGCEVLAPATPDARAGVRIAERAMRRLKGPDGSVLRLLVKDLDGRAQDLALVRTVSSGKTVALQNLPPESGTVDTVRATTPAGASVGIVRFSTWHPAIAQTLADAMASMQSGGALVLDLRGNTGGVAQMFPWLAGYVVPSGTALGVFRFRDHVQPLCAAVQTASVYTGPFAVLVDTHSHSTSEMFAASMQSLGRSRTFGDTTFGGVVGALYDRLPNGDVLEHAVVDFETSTGSHPEARGVIPEQIVQLSSEDLRRGRDSALIAALAWIDRERASGTKASAPTRFPTCVQ